MLAELKQQRNPGSKHCAAAADPQPLRMLPGQCAHLRGAALRLRQPVAAQLAEDGRQLDHEV